MFRLSPDHEEDQIHGDVYGAGRYKSIPRKVVPEEKVPEDPEEAISKEDRIRSSLTMSFQDAFDPAKSQLDGMARMFEIRNFVAEEWPHVLVWDLFVGRAIWKDGINREIDTRLSLAFCNFIGPPGLLIHVATCALTGKGLPKM